MPDAPYTLYIGLGGGGGELKIYPLTYEIFGEKAFFNRDFLAKK
jgi:hypothetical protein